MRSVIIKCCYYMEVKVIAIPFVFVSAIALFVSLVINIFVVAVFAEVRTLRYDNCIYIHAFTLNCAFNVSIK